MTRGVVNVIGAGYAGIEAALTLAFYGAQVHLFDVPISRDEKITQTKTNKQIKKELCALKVKSISDENDNLQNLYQKMQEKLKKTPQIKIFNQKVFEISQREPTIIATGENTDLNLMKHIATLIGKEHTHTHLAIEPIFDGDIKGVCEGEKLFVAVSDQTLKRAYNFLLGCNFSEEETLECWANESLQLLRAKAFKPALVNGKVCKNVLRLVKTDQGYKLLGFQTKLSQTAQKKLFSFFPELKNAKIVRYGKIAPHTFITPATCLNQKLQCLQKPNIFFAGGIISCEGELEAIATGHLAALNVINTIDGRALITFPPLTALGKIVENLFAFASINYAQIQKSCDIIRLDKPYKVQSLAKLKENYDARISWHNNLCSKKRW